MKYVEFMERVRRSLVVYESTLASYFEGSVSKEAAEKILDSARADIANQIDYYLKNKEEELGVGKLCPRCNQVKAKEQGSPKLAVHPARVGQLMRYTSDVWRGHEWDECPLCGCQHGWSKIEHWE